MPEFVHLHVHTEYSLLDSTVRIPQLAGAARAAGFRAVAMTDRAALFGAVPFVEACRQAGLRPVLGAEVDLGGGTAPVPGGSPGPGRAASRPLVLLAAGLDGYRSLSRLLTELHLESPHPSAATLEVLARHARGLVCLSGGPSGPLGAALLQDQAEQARRLAGDLRDIFGPGNFYLELQDHGLAQEAALNRALVGLAGQMGLPLVATNDVHYLRPEEARLHDLLVAVREGRPLNDPGLPRLPGSQYYLRPAQEMALRFGEVPEALTATLAIAERCEASLPGSGILLPQYPLPAGETDPDRYLRRLCEEGLAWRYPGTPDRAVRDRLEHELSVIQRMGYASYFLIVWDFIRYARSRGIPVGPGRGSGAGSLVAYLLGITGIDPLRHGLLFERFLNPERVDMPDLDIDFCYERRGEVIDYVVGRYGPGRVAQIITFGTLGARAAVRDVGRALGLRPSDVDWLARRIPPGRGLTEALREQPDLERARQSSRAAAEVLGLAAAVEGLPRHPSVHAAGVVIAPGPLVDYVPLYRTSEGVTVTQFDMDHLKAIGLLKMDFLGLRTLTVISRAAAEIRRYQPDFDPDRIPEDDPPTLQLLARGETAGVFQLEAGWVADVLRRLRPERFSDIVATISLCRPGPMQHIPDFLAARHGTPRYPHPDLEPILRDTYGVMIYQEQIMQVAARIAGFSLGEADLLRRAMAKKQPEALARYRERFLEGAARRGYDARLAAELFEDILKFAGYGFNAAHAAAYATLAYQTAYLKRHYPAEFMAALLTSVIGDEDKVRQYAGECRRLGIRLLPPDVQVPAVRFEVEQLPAEAGAPRSGARPPAAIRFSLAAVRGVGQGMAQAIVRGRAEGGPFRSLEDFVARVGARELGRRAIEALIRAGALDSLGEPRSALLARVGAVVEAVQGRPGRSTGQATLFDLLGGESAPAPPERPAGPARVPLEGLAGQTGEAADDVTTRRRMERESLGMALTERQERALYLRVLARSPRDSTLEPVLRLLREYPGPDRVRLKLELSGRWLELGPQHRVRITDGLVGELRRLLGEGSVAVRP